MRLVVVVLSLLVATTAIAEARKPKPPSQKREQTKQASRGKQVAVREDPPRRNRERDRAQSFGAPWNGYLQHGTRLKIGDGAYIRRPYRAFGTRTTVDFTKRAIEETLELHPKAHVLAIGDLSAEHGGHVTDHNSHQSGRDVDLGLFYKRKPPGYPNSFIDGTERNLDAAATWTLISKLASTAGKDGGVWVIFLDYEVQGVLYRWAKQHGVSDKRLEKVLQYPHGRGASAGIVRHYRNHAHHIHARFKCTRAETSCR